MLLFLFFFFKQKTAYEMRISDWSSDVFSSDLSLFPPGERVRSTPAALRRSASRGAHAAAGTALMAMGLSGGGGRRRGGRGTRAPMAEINVTPLVDVMLVLLIIFMVTAPLLKAAVPIELPDSRAKAMSEEAEQIGSAHD